uniref:Uncharacterized protein n=1 Tax=Arundo donax TaxID=35708 RepID=A0A0A9GEX3_ARUDO
MGYQRMLPTLFLWPAAGLQPEPSSSSLLAHLSLMVLSKTLLNQVVLITSAMASTTVSSFRLSLSIFVIFHV